MSEVGERGDARMVAMLDGGDAGSGDDAPPRSSQNRETDRPATRMSGRSPVPPVY